MMTTERIQLGIDYATRQCEGLIKFGIPGLHFYSLNKSYSLQAHLQKPRTYRFVPKD